MVPPNFPGRCAAPEHSFSKITPREAMFLVPRADELVFEVKVAPQDAIRSHQEQRRSCTSWPATSGTTLVIMDSVTRVSADITREQQNSNQPAQEFNRGRVCSKARTFAQCFLGLSNLDPTLLDRLGRYEARLWRQAAQTIWTLDALRRPPPTTARRSLRKPVMTVQNFISHNFAPLAR
jgi:hypothetical protein